MAGAIVTQFRHSLLPAGSSQYSGMDGIDGRWYLSGTVCRRVNVHGSLLH